MKVRALFAAAVLIAAPMSASYAQADTVTPPRPLFTSRDLLLAGVFTVGAIAARPLDRHFAERLQQRSAQENQFLQKTSAVVRTIAVPGALYIGGGMYIAGRVSKSHKLADLGWHGTEALLIGEGVASVMKGVFGRARPYTDT